MVEPVQIAAVRLPPYLRAPEAAEFLRITTKTLRRLASQNRVPRPRRVGGRLLWSTRELLSFLSSTGEQPAEVSSAS